MLLAAGAGRAVDEVVHKEDMQPYGTALCNILKHG